MTEVERFVRDRVEATGAPCLVLLADSVPSLDAIPMWAVFMDGERGIYVLVPTDTERGDADSWADATLAAQETVRKFVPMPPEGVDYVFEHGAIDVVRQVEATALGLSLLQLALNHAGSGLGIACRNA